MPKVTQQQLMSLLSNLIGDVQLVENETDSDFSEEAVLQSLDNNRLPIIKQKVHGEIHQQLSRQINDKYRKLLSEKTGISVADLKDLGDNEIIERAFEHFKGSLPDQTKESQQRIQEILDAHTQEKTRISSEYENKLKDVETKLTRKSMLDVLNRYHRDAKGLPEKANREKLAQVFLQHLESQGIVKLNETGDDIEIYDRTNPEYRLLDQSKSKQIGVADFIKPYYSDLGMWNEDTRDVPATTAAKNAPSGINTTPAAPSAPAGNAAASYQQFVNNLNK
jgi:hypothetical protein